MFIQEFDTFGTKASKKVATGAIAIAASAGGIIPGSP